MPKFKKKKKKEKKQSPDGYGGSKAAFMAELANNNKYTFPFLVSSWFGEQNNDQNTCGLLIFQKIKNKNGVLRFETQKDRKK